MLWQYLYTEILTVPNKPVPDYLQPQICLQHYSVYIQHSDLPETMGRCYYFRKSNCRRDCSCSASARFLLGCINLTWRQGLATDPQTLMCGGKYIRSINCLFLDSYTREFHLQKLYHAHLSFVLPETPKNETVYRQTQNKTRYIAHLNRRTKFRSYLTVPLHSVPIARRITREAEVNKLSVPPAMFARDATNALQI